MSRTDLLSRRTKANITLTLDADLNREARVVAADEGRSGALVSDAMLTPHR
jgi:hypothetical protein